MNHRHIPVASEAAVEALAEANGAAVARAEGYASTTLPDGATYFYAAAASAVGGTREDRRMSEVPSAENDVRPTCDHLVCCRYHRCGHPECCGYDIERWGARHMRVVPPSETGEAGA